MAGERPINASLRNKIREATGKEIRPIRRPSEADVSCLVEDLYGYTKGMLDLEAIPEGVRHSSWRESHRVQATHIFMLGKILRILGQEEMVEVIERGADNVRQIRKDRASASMYGINES